MIPDSGGGGGSGNPYAGPHEQKLLRTLDARMDTIMAAARQWQAVRQALDGVVQNLGADREALAEALGPRSETAQTAASAYQTVEEAMRRRVTDLQDGYSALETSYEALSAAQSACADLGPTPCDPNQRDSDVERLLDPGGMLRRARHDNEVSAREKRAKAALDNLDEGLDQSARGFAKVAGEPAPDFGGGRNGSSSRSSSLGATTAPGPVESVVTGPTRPATDGGTVIPPGGTRPDQPTVPLPGGNGSGTPGSPSGGPEIPAVGDPGTVGAGSPGGSSAVTPGVGTGAAAAGAIGAGAVSGAGAVAASRGTAAPRVVPGSNSGAIGRSATSAGRGTLGRTGPLVGGQPGGTGAGRTGARAGGRGPLVGGNQATAGRAGSRGQAGGRTGPMAAPAGGARTKRDEEREREIDHLQIEDEQGWLDDEGVTDPVID